MKRALKTVSIVLSLFLIMLIWLNMSLMRHGEKVSIAKATDIAANMRALKAAALMYLADNLSSDKHAVMLAPNDLLKYIDSNVNYTVAEGKERAKEGDYMITTLDDGGAWYVGYKFAKDDDEAVPKLARRSKQLGFLNKDGKDFSASDSEVYMYIR